MSAARRAAHPNHSALTRFISSLRIDAKTQCWEWEGQRLIHGGYGTLMVNRKIVRAHRFSYEVFNGPIPHGLLVRHRCDNPPCVNPEHLELGTHQDNTDDKMRRGRGSGWRCKTSRPLKVSPDEVARIRADREAGLRYSDLAAKYGHGETTIARIVRRTDGYGG